MSNDTYTIPKVLDQVDRDHYSQWKTESIKPKTEATAYNKNIMNKEISNNPESKNAAGESPENCACDEKICNLAMPKIKEPTITYNEKTAPYMHNEQNSLVNSVEQKLYKRRAYKNMFTSKTIKKNKK